MRSLFRSLLFLLIAAHLGQPAASHAQDTQVYRGRSLQAVLDELRARGSPLVYSSNLVPSTLMVEREPRSSEPLALVRELLTPHGLAIQEAGGAWLVVRGAPVVVAPELGGIALTVVAGAATAPLADALVEVDPPAGRSIALVSGSAALDALPAGRHVLTVRAAGYLPERAVVNVVARETVQLTLALVAAAPKLDELTVTASRYDLRNDVRPSTAYFSREQIESLSELGDDALRIAHRLPGVATTEFSARSHVRGGAVDEMTVVLDGMTLLEPYHLRDYQSVFSAIDQRIVAGIQIYSGGFPAAYGDSLSGLMLIDQLEPTAQLRHEIGLSLLYTSALSSGTFHGGKGQWLASVRRGNIDRLLDDGLGDPSYRDGFLHVGMALGAKHRLALNDIGFDDDIEVTPENSPDHNERGRSDTDNNQVWLKLDSDWSEALSSRSLVYSTRFEAERHGVVDEIDEMVGFADDRRTLNASGLKQDWRWEHSNGQLLTWGFAAEQLDGRYDYASAVDLRGVLATLESEPVRQRSHTLTPHGESYDAYVSDRVRVTDRLIAELGLRWDKQTYLPPGDDEQFSPRSSLLVRLDSATDLRFSFGRFFQAERLLDLQVEDDVLGFAPAQSASHSIVGVEHRFADDLTLRVEAFRKWTHSARPRYENLFDPLVLLPELRPGRVRIAPDRAESRGVELMLNAERRIDWWFGYSYARAVDVIGGDRVPRSWDQRHAVSGGLSWQAGPWTLSSVASIHTGWPTTTLALTTVGSPPETIAVPGERNADRLGSVRRVDFRASKDFEAGPGSLRFFAEVANVTNRRNPCCVSYDPVDVSGEPLRLDRVERKALPLTANVGVLWQF